MKLFSLCLALLFYTSGFAQKKKAPVKKATTSSRLPTKRVPPKVVENFTKVKITTDSGVMVLKLYNKTPQHRDNFIKLANEKFFDSTLFHRVINQFMIQGGDPSSKYAQQGQMLGSGENGYTIPAEFDTTLFHKKGALAAARTENPEKRSSGCQFYIVQGKKYTDAELNQLEGQMGIKFSKTKRLTYKTVGGTPFLDMNYTVFGEVITGMNVIDKIAKMQGDYANRPTVDIRMKVEIIQ